MIITEHSFLAKCQANFLKAKKESLKMNEGIVLGDFAENYQFLVKDEIQSYYWSREYSTYTHSLHILLTVVKIFNTILFVSSLMITTTIKILLVKYKQSLLITLKKTFQLCIRSSISEDRFAKSETVPRTKGVVTILYQYLTTNLLTKSQVKIEGFFNLISATHCLKK